MYLVKMLVHFIILKKDKYYFINQYQQNFFNNSIYNWIWIYACLLYSSTVVYR